MGLPARETGSAMTSQAAETQEQKGSHSILGDVMQVRF